MDFKDDMKQSASSLSYEDIAKSIRGSRVKTKKLSQGEVQIHHILVDKNITRFTNPPKRHLSYNGRLMY